MNNSKNLSPHYLALAGVIALGTLLRFWHLDLKPLWLDEVLTALLSLGHRYTDIPLEEAFPLSILEHLLKLQPNLSCADIAEAVATQSTHPPLFFCLMHQWLNWVKFFALPLSWNLRALPALFGVGAIATIYCLNRVAFSPRAGFMAATLMAVSPFSVYLSQEARHYTLPVLLIILALLGLIQIQQDLFHRQQLPKLTVWLGWVAANSIGLYTHYFFILAFIAQLVTFIAVLYRWHGLLRRGGIVAMCLAVGSVSLGYLPWLPVLLGHMGRSETNWLPSPQHIVPIYQVLSSWLTMVIILPLEALLPIEGSPSPIQVLGAILMTLLMLGFFSWVVWQSFRGLKQLWRSPTTHLATFTLASFILCVLLEFFAIVYILGKDITVGFRYNFVYYPALCALLAASLVNGRRQKGIVSFLQRFYKLRSRLSPSSWRTYFIILLVGVLSCVFVVSNLAFQKGFNPQKVAQDMNLEPTLPLMVVMGYRDSQDVALGLSFALALDKVRTLPQDSSLEKTTDTYFAFLNRSTGYDSVWQKLSTLPVPSITRWNLWVVAPGLKRRDYPPQLAIANQTTCHIDPTHHHRIGIPYQMYECR